MNERRLRVSKRERMADCLIGTGFPFRSLEHLDEYVQMFKSITEALRGYAGRAPPRSISRMSLPAGSMDSGRSACRRGTWPPAAY